MWFIQQLKSNAKMVRFFAYAIVLYIGWYLLFEQIIKPYTYIDKDLIGLIISNTAFVLTLFGFNVYQSVEDHNMHLVGIDGTHPIWVDGPCSALTLFALFSIFIIAFPGNTKYKFWFIPLGIIIIHLANVLRVVSLACINYYAPQYIEFNHTYTFTLIVYGIIFYLWMRWVRLNLKQTPNRNEKN